SASPTALRILEEDEQIVKEKAREEEEEEEEEEETLPQNHRLYQRWLHQSCGSPPHLNRPGGYLHLHPMRSRAASTGTANCLSVPTHVPPKRVIGESSVERSYLTDMQGSIIISKMERAIMKMRKLGKHHQDGTNHVHWEHRRQRRMGTMAPTPQLPTLFTTLVNWDATSLAMPPLSDEGIAMANGVVRLDDTDSSWCSTESKSGITGTSDCGICEFQDYYIQNGVIDGE
ncbi:hypothetical protein TSMEX_009386, partial [Taenia solium]